MAAVSLLDATEQRFKARIGIDLERTPVEHAFCRYTVQDDAVLVVPDAHADERFATNPLVLGAPHIRSYAGAPLELANGERVGALCVLDVVPREVGDRERALLALLARAVVGHLELERLVTTQSQAIIDMHDTQRELHHRATHDDLTQVLNRRGLLSELDSRLASEQRHGATEPVPLGICFVDLDNFKMINDTHGHELGDRVLTAAARRLVGATDPTDLVGRIGGDEFVVVARTRSATDDDRTAQALLDCLATPFVFDDVVVSLTASIGIARAVGSATAIDLIHQADRAMYAVKQSGGARAAGHHEQEQAATNVDLRSRTAFVAETLNHGEITAHYQPIVDLVTGQTVRHEALVRWHADEPAGTTPASFIEAAESGGLIRDVGREVLLQACGTCASDEISGGIAVNVSPIQVTQGLEDDIALVLEWTGLDPQLLTIEITEAQSLGTSSATRRALDRLSDLGVRLSLDDFGTGYSSLGMLCEFPFSELKVDRMFCASSDPKVLQIVGAAAGVANSFGLHVVAEGIESAEVAQRMRDLGCDSGQGFHFGRPVPASALVHAGIT